MKKYSVIIPIYNMEKYLGECIESILKQNRNDVEIILINDGSKDSSLDVCNNYKTKCNNIIVIDKENSGTTETLRRGIEQSDSIYTVFLDADDVVSDNFFSSLDKFVNDEEFDIIMFDFKRMYQNNNIEMKVNNISYGILEGLELEKLKKEVLCDYKKYSFYRWNKIIKTSIIKETIKEISEKTIYFEDILFGFINLLKSNKLIYIDQMLYFYRMRDNSVSHSVNNKIFNDLEIIENALLKKVKELNFDNEVTKQVKLYFSYQYARYSLKSNECYYNRKIDLKNIVDSVDKDKKLVLLLYKLRLKKIYKLILYLKYKKERKKKLVFFK